MDLAQKDCPVCGNASARVTIRPEFDATKQSWSVLAEGWSGLFSKKMFFPYFRCEQCGLLYNKAYFTQEQLNELYRGMAPNMAEAVAPALLKDTQEGYFDLIAGAVSSEPGAYLELGPDIGTFARKCSSTIAFDRYWLVEPNRAVWEELGSGIGAEAQIDADMALIDQIPNGSVKLAVGIHVLDHLLDPVAALRAILPKMAPEGIILSVTHDEGSVMARVLRGRWPAYCLQHPQLYNGRSIQSTLAAASFDTMRVTKTKNTFALGFLIRQGLWATIGLSIKKLPGLDAIPVRLRLGNIAAVAKSRA